jgi:hypothetical protein
MQAFSRAAEGIRTLDLLHGKQNVSFRLGADIHANGRVLGCGCRPAIPRLLTGVHRGFRHPRGTQHSAVPNPLRRSSRRRTGLAPLGRPGGGADAAALAAPGLAALLDGERGGQEADDRVERPGADERVAEAGRAAARRRGRRRACSGCPRPWARGSRAGRRGAAWRSRGRASRPRSRRRPSSRGELARHRAQRWVRGSSPARSTRTGQGRTRGRAEGCGDETDSGRYLAKAIRTVDGVAVSSASRPRPVEGFIGEWLGKSRNEPVNPI